MYPISHLGSTRLGFYLRVQFLYIALTNQEMEETCDNIMLFHFTFFLFMYLHFIVSYYVMVQVCSAAVESG